MKRLARIGMVMGGALLAALPATALAQDAAQNAAGQNSIGDPRLRDFSLGRPATPPPTAQPAPQPAPATAAPTATAPARAPAPTAAAPRAARPTASPGPAPGQQAPAPTIAQPTTAQPTITLPPITEAPPVVVPIAPTAAPAPVGTRDWPWLAIAGGVAGLLALLAGWLWSRRRRARSAAIAAAIEAEAPVIADTPPSRPAPPPPPPPPVAVPDTITSSIVSAPVAPASPTPSTAPAAGGIVATGLAPRPKIALQPLAALLGADGGMRLQMDVIVQNIGHAPARDVRFSATLVQAGARQDEEIAAIFRAPPADAGRFGTVDPQSAMAMQVECRVAPEEMRPIEIDGRRLFVPFVAVILSYDTPAGRRQEQASFLFGVRGGASGDGRLAPFRVDTGARQWTDLEVRHHSDGLVEA